ncbi:MAG: lectin-like protein, partial [Phycisphaerales bacterium]
MGGNGHWYAKIETGSVVSWTSAKSQAESLGGQLSCHETPAENQFVWQHAVQPTLQNWDAWIGLQKVGSQWRWLTGPATYTSWTFNSPDGDCGNAAYAHFHQQGPTWNDLTEDGIYCFGQSTSTCGTGRVCSFLVEWSADCNGDGVVDFGQIRSGQLVDDNADNIPDACQCPIPHVVRVPQDASSIAAAVALACPNNPMEIVLSPGIWPMAIDTGDPALSFTIRGLDTVNCVVTSAGAGTLLNARQGSAVRLANLTVADLVPGGGAAQDLAWEIYFDGCVVRNCTGSFLFDDPASPYPAAADTRFESCTGSTYGILYCNGSETIDGCEFAGCSRAIAIWGP